MAAFIAALVAKVPPEGTPPPEPQRYMCMVSIAQSTLSASIGSLDLTTFALVFSLSSETASLFSD